MASLEGAGPLRPANAGIDRERWLELQPANSSVVENDFQPGQTTGWHSHPGPSEIFVVTGSITNYASDQWQCKGVTYAAGTAFLDAGGTDVHELVNAGTAPAETIAVQFIPHGQARRIDKPEPSNCHV